MITIKKKAVLNNGWLVYSNDIDILMELLTDNNSINWHNFTNGEYFYSDRDVKYVIEMDEEEKIITLMRRF